VHQKDVAGSRGRPWSEGQGVKPPEAETLLAFGHSMVATNLPAFVNFEKAKSRISCRNDA